MRRGITLFSKPLQGAVSSDKKLSEALQQFLYVRMLKAIADGLEKYAATLNSRKQGIKVTQEEYVKFNGWGCGI